MKIAGIKIQTFINSLPYSAVILNEEGIIEVVNDNWKAFARENSLDPANCGPGINYLRIAEKAEGVDEEIAKEAAGGIKAVLEGEREEFSLEYPCHSPEENRWFKMVVEPLDKGAFILHENITERKLSSAKLEEKSAELENFFNLIPGLLSFADLEGNFLRLNKAWEEVLGYTVDELKNLHFTDIVHPEDLKKSEEALEQLVEENQLIDFTARLRGKDGDYRYLEWHAARQGERIYAAARDVTEYKRAEKQLNERIKELNCLYETAKLLSDFKSPLEKSLQKAADIIKSGWQYPDKTSVKIVYDGIEVYSDDFEKSSHNLSRKIPVADDKEGELIVYCSMEDMEDTSPFLNGEVKLIDSLAELLRHLIRRNKNQERLKYLAHRDQLTGLYKHSFFDEQMKRLDYSEQLPMSIYLLDINGLQLFNESFGHKTGNKILKRVADKLNSAVRKKDIIARWGEDEFAVLMPQTDREEAEIVKERTEKLFENITVEEMMVSISGGLATKYKPEKNPHEVLNEALDRLERDKLTKSSSSKSKMVQSLLNALLEKSEETEVHADRMEMLAQKLGEKAGLSDDELNSLSLLAKLHDIGKIMIPEDILKKPGKLNDKEWEKIETHPKVGSNIVAATEEFSHIAEAIRHHHEHWNGEGYPDGLKGEEIPLLARIISIVDAYDVITNNRAYKEASSKKEATEILHQPLITNK